ncbi:hypothetical protein D3C76_1163040 [compost metagenome]
MDKGLKNEVWSSEKIEEHCKRIGADKPPIIVVSSRLDTTAPQMAMKSGRYHKRGGEY